MLLTHALENSAAPGTVRATSASVVPLAAHHFVEQAGQGRHAGRVVGHDGTGQIGIGITFAAKEVPSFGYLALVFHFYELAKLFGGNVQCRHSSPFG